MLFFGSSITYGTDVVPDDTFTRGLQDRLDTRRSPPGFCVLNFAQPGFQFEQKFAVAAQEVPRYRPALIMWESWIEWRRLRILGDAAYGISDYRSRPDGFIGIAGVPDVLNRTLFLHSRLYQYLALGYGDLETNPPAARQLMTAFANQQLVKMVDVARSANAKFVMYFAPPLDQPFAETEAKPAPENLALLEFAQAQGIPSYFLARDLLHQNHLELRLDPCGHFNAAGHHALAPVMERIVLAELNAPPTTGE